MKMCSVETDMNRSGSHPGHENRLIIISTELIRRGGARSGAAAFIIFGGMGVSTPISNSRRPIFMGNHMILIETLSEALKTLRALQICMVLMDYADSAPAARASPGCDSAVLPVHMKFFSVQVIRGIAMRPRPQRGLGWRKGGDHVFK